MTMNYSSVLVDIVKSVEHNQQDGQVVVTTNDNGKHHLTMGEWALFTHGPTPTPANLTTASKKTMHDRTTYINQTGHELRKMGNDSLTVYWNRRVDGVGWAEDEQESIALDIWEQPDPVDSQALGEFIGAEMEKHKAN